MTKGLRMKYGVSQNFQISSRGSRQYLSNGHAASQNSPPKVDIGIYIGCELIEFR